MKNNSRREFISRSGAAMAGLSLGLFNIDGAANNLTSGLYLDNKKRPIHVFTKVLQFLDYQEMAEMLAEKGFAGADLTVREGGQVLPENVKKDLPIAIKALHDAGVGSEMITTNIIDADDKNTRPILKTMADQGIDFYRTGYLDYDHSRSMETNLDNFKRIFGKLEQLNREYGVHGGYQNHSGRRVGGPVWDLYPLLKNCDPRYLGVQYDIRHATVEGAVSWPLGLRLLAPWIKSIDIKDFLWEKNMDGEWRIKNVPLGEGMVDFDAFFELYKSYDIQGPVSIHYEYDLGGAEHGRLNPSITKEEIAGWLGKDLDFLTTQLRKSGLE